MLFARELAQDELGNERQRVPKTDQAVWVTFVFAGAKTRRCWAGRLHAVGRSKAGRPTRDNGHGKTFTLLQGGGKGATTKTKKGEKDYRSRGWGRRGSVCGVLLQQEDPQEMESRQIKKFVWHTRMIVLHACMHACLFVFIFTKT